MIGLPYRKIFGSRIRYLREQRQWSQSRAAQQVPLSQKQWSRIELGDVSGVDRPLLIRLGEIFEEPLATGELNQWLHAFGYRPHMVPGLPLPPNFMALLSPYGNQPVAILDIGRFLRHANPSMESLYHFRLGSLSDVQRNWLWQYFHPKGLLHNAYSSESITRILNSLYWAWQPYYLESWNQALRAKLEDALGLTWSSVQSAYHIPTVNTYQPLNEFVKLASEAGELIFATEIVHVPFRPDLYVVVYHPDNDAARQWCAQWEMV